MKILWITNIPSPYRVDFFNMLGKSCNLTVLFERNNASNRDETWNSHDIKNFQKIVLKGVKVTHESSLCVDVLKHLKKNIYTHIIISNPMTPTGAIAIEFMKLRRIPFIIEGDGGFAKSGNSAREKLKTHILKGAKLYFSTSIKHDKYYSHYGVSGNKIKRYPFTSIKKNEIIDEPLSFEAKQDLRKKLNIKESKMILFVGQYIHRKGIDVLLNAVRGLGKDVGVYIIGGIPTDEYLVLKKNLNLNNVHFLEFQTKERLSLFYQAADLFVLPTRYEPWGLVINEAMANGLPIITTDKCIAGLELVANEINGYIVPVDDVNVFEKSISKVLEDSDLQKSMSINSLKIVSDYTIEKMVESHIKVFNTLNNL